MGNEDEEKLIDSAGCFWSLIDGLGLGDERAGLPLILYLRRGSRRRRVGTRECRGGVPCESSFFLWPCLPRRTRDGLEVDWDGEAARNFSFLDVVGTMVWFHAWIRNAFKINHTWAVFG